MREIKFRAWDEAGNPIKSYYNHNKYISIDTAKIINVEHDDVVSEGVVYGEDEAVLLEQYTGLKDKNGVEIYEGDMLKCISKNEFSKGDVIKRCVIWGSCGWHLKGTYMNLSEFLNYGDCEIIGNIHENQELLK